MIPRFFAGPARPKADTLREYVARQMAHEIERIWRRAGYPTVKAWAEPMSHHIDMGHKDFTVSLFCVRSNLVNGLPPT